MDNDLVSIYEHSYLRGNVIEEKKAAQADVEKEDSEDSEDSAPTKSSPRFKKAKKKIMSKKEIGAITYDSFKRSENIFDKILREMDEMGGDIDSSGSVDDNVFDANEEYTGEEDEQTFTLSELKSMTLAELADLIAGGVGEEDESVGDDFDYSGDVEEGDEIPAESYGFVGGEGNYPGDQGKYDGKARRQSPSSHVKSNGDADFGKQDTGYDPDDTEGSEGAEHGAQGNYDGKAKRQPASTFVKSNGDADFGKVKTGHKTSSGKKDKNYF